MSSRYGSSRQILAHAVVACGAIFGATSLLLAPLEHERLRGERELIALRLESANSAQREHAQRVASVAVDSASMFGDAIETRSAGARDELALHRVYHEIAAKWRIDIDRFDPSLIKVSEPRRKSQEELILPSFAASVRIDAIAPLDRVVGMIDELAETAGFVSVRSLTITPVADSADRSVRVRLECEHYAFADDHEAQPSTSKSGREN